MADNGPRTTLSEHHWQTDGRWWSMWVGVDPGQIALGVFWTCETRTLVFRLGPLYLGWGA